MKPSTISALHDGLWMVVNAAGTGVRGRVVGRDVSGKTGTAQVISLTGAKIARGKMDVRDHGWFVFFAPRDNPVLAGVIFAESSEHGYLGAPIAKHVIETYYAKKEGKPLPVLQKLPPPADVIAADDAGAPARAATRHRQDYDVRTPSLFSRRLAAPGSRGAAGRHRPRHDLQHDVRPSAGRQRASRA